jgi:hypothetical protein
LGLKHVRSASAGSSGCGREQENKDFMLKVDFGGINVELCRDQIGPSIAEYEYGMD